MEKLIDRLLTRLQKAERRAIGTARTLTGTVWRAQTLMRKRNQALRKAEAARRALPRLQGKPEYHSAFARWKAWERSAANLEPEIVDTLRRNWR